MPTLKGSLILEGGSEAHPQEVSGVKLYNEEGKYSVGIQAGGASNGATYIELSDITSEKSYGIQATANIMQPGKYQCRRIDELQRSNIHKN